MSYHYSYLVFCSKKASATISDNDTDILVLFSVTNTKQRQYLISDSYRCVSYLYSVAHTQQTTLMMIRIVVLFPVRNTTQLAVPDGIKSYRQPILCNKKAQSTATVVATNSQLRQCSSFISYSFLSFPTPHPHPSKAGDQRRQCL